MHTHAHTLTQGTQNALLHKALTFMPLHTHTWVFALTYTGTHNARFRKALTFTLIHMHT